MKINDNFEKENLKKNSLIVIRTSKDLKKTLWIEAIEKGLSLSDYINNILKKRNKNE